MTARATDLSDTEVDARLLAELAAGESGALAELYRRRGGTLLAMLSRMLGDEREAEEALQDTFVRLWRRASDYDAARAGPLTWMILLARGLAMDRIRRRSNRIDTSSEEAAAVVESSLTENGFTHAAAGETASRVSQALAKLPIEQREALELAFWNGCTQAEIAQTTGAPLGTIKARIRRGMLGLRQLLKERYG